MRLAGLAFSKIAFPVIAVLVFGVSGFLVSCGGLIDEGVPGTVPSSTLESEARVVVRRLTPEYTTEVLACRTDGEPVSLGVLADDSYYSSVPVISPDGRRVAVERMEGSVIVDLTTFEEIAVPGAGAGLRGARWSPSGDRLAYFVDGVPWLVSPDGGLAEALDIEVPPPTSSAGQYQGAEWSPDGQKVAFVTRGWGILTNRDGEGPWIFSESMIGPYGSPWAVAFSPDGTTLAGLQSDPAGYTRTVLLLDIPGRAGKQLELEHYMLTGWASDSSGVMVMDVYIHTWFLPKNGSEPRDFGFAAQLSPKTPEVVMQGPGLPIEDLRDGRVRTLLPDSEIVSSVSWEAGGDIVWYSAAGGSGFLRASDGTPLGGFEAQTVQGIVSHDGWVVVLDPAVGYYYPGDLLVWDLLGNGSVARIPWDSGGYPYIDPNRIQWLPGGRLAFLATDGTHIVRPDGSDDRVVCPFGDVIYQRQADTIDARF